MKQGIKTSHSEIAKYWANKYILPTGDIEDRLVDESFKVVWDVNTPECWGCGKIVKHFNGELERSHIVPNALGGKDTPENLFLLCPECHFYSPDTVNRKAFFRWIYNRRKQYVFGKLNPAYLVELVNEELKQRGAPTIEEMLNNIPEDYQKQHLSAESLKEYFEKHVGTHATAIVESSVTVGVADWILHEYTKALLNI